MRRFIAILVLLVATIPLVAQTQHQIRKIEFRSRIPTSMLLTQSALSENRTYTDADLDVAMARLRRLPFIYSAGYAIEGTTLVIEVLDEHYGFFHLDTLAQQSDGGLGSDNGFASAELGGRYYAPWGGAGEATYGASSVIGSSAYSFQYSQYGIAGSRLFFVVSAARPRSGGTQPTYMIGYPITLRQTITFTGSRTTNSDREVSGRDNLFTSKSVDREMELAWQWDTTNDPLFATRGLMLHAGRGKTSNESEAKSVTPTRVIFSTQSTIDADSWHGAAEKFWPAGHGAFSANADAQWFDEAHKVRSVSTDPWTSYSGTTRSAYAIVGYAHDFFSSVSQPTSSRRRLELGIGVTSWQSKVRGFTTKRNSKNARLGYAFRNRWGNLHVVLSYLQRIN